MSNVHPRLSESAVAGVKIDTDLVVSEQPPISPEWSIPMLSEKSYPEMIWPWITAKLVNDRLVEVPVAAWQIRQIETHGDAEFWARKHGVRFFEIPPWT